MQEILIVDDERTIRETLKTVFSGDGFLVRTARDGEEALKKISENAPDLVLLDVMMPKMNGFRCCEEIRATNPLLPIIFLTAKDSDADQVHGIGIGGDDYVAKSAEDSVLLARVHRALARAEEFDRQRAVADVDGLRIDLNALVVRDGRSEIRLTRTEGDILRILMMYPNKFKTKDEIIDGLRGRGFACEDGMIYVHMHNLRKKLGDSAERLVCDRNSGYKFVI